MPVRQSDAGIMSKWLNNRQTFFHHFVGPSFVAKSSNRDDTFHLQWTVIGPSWPNCSLVLCTWPTKSMNPSPDLGTPCSGQSVNWNWRTVRDCPSCTATSASSLSLATAEKTLMFAWTQRPTLELLRHINKHKYTHKTPVRQPITSVLFPF